MDALLIQDNINSIFSVFHERGQEEYHGEPVSQLEHAVQTAEFAQKNRPDDPEFIIAAFLHDFGHLCRSPKGNMDGYGAWEHEAIGAFALRELGFSEKIASLVANHVQAKRYLVSTDQAYYAALSEASKITFEKQGGRLSPEDLQAFEQDPFFDLHIQLRRLDEQAKAVGKPVGSMGWLERIIREHLSQNTTIG
jgi:2-amino-1-hydroxyethylphosphonate dioxygenase (glycine-forming)